MLSVRKMAPLHGDAAVSVPPCRGAVTGAQGARYSPKPSTRPAHFGLACAAGQALAGKPARLGRAARAQDFFGAPHAAAARRGEGHHRLAGEVVAFQERVHDGGRHVPPDGKAHEHRVVGVHALHAVGYGRARGGVVHLHAAAASSGRSNPGRRPCRARRARSRAGRRRSRPPACAQGAPSRRWRKSRRRGSSWMLWMRSLRVPFLSSVRLASLASGRSVRSRRAVAARGCNKRPQRGSRDGLSPRAPVVFRCVHQASQAQPCQPFGGKGVHVAEVRLGDHEAVEHVRVRAQRAQVGHRGGDGARSGRGERGKGLTCKVAAVGERLHDLRDVAPTIRGSPDRPCRSRRGSARRRPTRGARPRFARAGPRPASRRSRRGRVRPALCARGRARYGPVWLRPARACCPCARNTAIAAPPAAAPEEGASCGAFASLCAGVPGSGVESCAAPSCGASCGASSASPRAAAKRQRRQRRGRCAHERAAGHGRFHMLHGRGPPSTFFALESAFPWTSGPIAANLFFILDVMTSIVILKLKANFKSRVFWKFLAK